MIRVVWLLGLMMAVSLVAGCGGGGILGGGGGDDGAIDPNVSLLGRWQPMSATEGGAVVPMATAMDWDPTWTCVELEFFINGTCTLQAYQDGTLVDTLTGSWSSDNQIAPITIGSQSTVMAYLVIGNLLTGTYALGGHTYEAKWVKVVTLTEHEADLVGTWQAASVKVNGVDVPVAVFFDFEPGSDARTLQLSANGSAVSREMAGSTVVSSETGTWATGGYTFTLTMDGDQIRGQSNIIAGRFVSIFLNPADGKTIEITWDRL